MSRGLRIGIGAVCTILLTFVLFYLPRPNDTTAPDSNSSKHAAPASGAASLPGDTVSPGKAPAADRAPQRLAEALRTTTKLAGTRIDEVSLHNAQKSVHEPAEAERTVIRRINQYFADEVWPTVRECFADLPEGRLELKHRFVNDGNGNWQVAPENSVELVDSSLPPEFDQEALDCVAAGIQDTAFPIEEGQGDEPTNVIYWTWTTPVVDAYEARYQSPPPSSR